MQLEGNLVRRDHNHSSVFEPKPLVSSLLSVRLDDGLVLWRVQNICLSLLRDCEEGLFVDIVLRAKKNQLDLIICMKTTDDMATRSWQDVKQNLEYTDKSERLCTVPLNTPVSRSLRVGKRENEQV